MVDQNAIPEVDRSCESFNAVNSMVDENAIPKVDRSDSWHGVPVNEKKIDQYLSNKVEGKCRGDSRESANTSWPLFKSDPPIMKLDTFSDDLRTEMAQRFVEKADLVTLAIKKICDETAWEYGEAWSIDLEKDQIAKPVTRIQKLKNFFRGGFVCGEEAKSIALTNMTAYMTKEVQEIAEIKQFAFSCKNVNFPPGVGQPGRACVHRQMEFLQDLQQEPYSRFQRRAMAIKAGFHSTVCVPILWRNIHAGNKFEVAGVMVFFTRKVLESTQISQVVNHTLRVMSECPVLSVGPEDITRLAGGAHSGATHFTIANNQDPSTLAVEAMLKCGVCNCLAEDAMSLMPCMHTFCADCINNWTRAFPNCPNCEGPIHSVKPNRTLRTAKETYTAQTELQNIPVPLPADMEHGHDTRFDTSGRQSIEECIEEEEYTMDDIKEKESFDISKYQTVKNQMHLLHADSIKVKGTELKEEEVVSPVSGKGRGMRRRVASISAHKPLLPSEPAPEGVDDSDTWWEDRAKEFKEEGKDFSQGEPDLFTTQQQKMGCIQGIMKAFPGALPALEINRRALKVLAKEGFKPEKTLFGNSTCPDEVNRVRNLWAHFTWGDTFNLGGLAGIPFTGKTGFVAFSHHMPDDGGLLVLYASHVGVSQNGHVGFVERHGMQECGKACGAAIGAYSTLLKNPEHNVDPPSSDYQMWFVTRALKAHLKRIKTARDPQAEIPHVLYERIRAELLRMIPEDFKGKLALLGGIQINTPSGIPDYFLAKSFETMEYDTEGNMTLNPLTDRLLQVELERSVRGASIDMHRTNSAETLGTLAEK